MLDNVAEQVDVEVTSSEVGYSVTFQNGPYLGFGMVFDSLVNF